MLNPNRIPEKGFYYHYKHNPADKFNSYAYEIVGICRHTEKQDNDPERYLVLYRPLYPNSYLRPANFSVRPLNLFLEPVVKNGVLTPRFMKIEDENLIQKLRAEKAKIYGDN